MYTATAAGNAVSWPFVSRYTIHTGWPKNEVTTEFCCNYLYV